MNRNGELARLKALLLEYSYQKREVKLSSGRMSDFYFDGKQTSLHPEGAYLLGRLILQKILERFPAAEAVGGPTLGADPIVTAVAVASFSEGHPIPAFIVRKEPKGHGTMHWIEGMRHLKPGMKVVLVEDVITSGGSLLKAVARVREAGLHVLGSVVIVDREEGGRENLEADAVPVISLLTKSELLG